MYTLHTARLRKTSINYYDHDFRRIRNQQSLTICRFVQSAIEGSLKQPRRPKGFLLDFKNTFDIA